MVKNSKILQMLKEPLATLSRLENQFVCYAAYHEEKNPPDKIKSIENRYWADQAEAAFNELRELQIRCSREELKGGEEPCQTNETISTVSSITRPQVWSYESLQKALSPLELSLVNRRMETYYLEQEKSQQSKEQ